ncbi:MAG: hypothetical protein R3291_05695, partial [Thermoplasmata archaeon]|nr:hypothetical protein [Thermoplasmata archaeon]
DQRRAEHHVKILETRSPVDGARARCGLSLKNEPEKKLALWTDLAKKLGKVLGPRSPTSRRLGLLEGWACNLGLQYRFPSKALDVEPDWLHLFLRERYQGGYAWIFPRGPEASVGVDVEHDPAGHLADFCRQWGLRKEDRTDTNGGRIPTRVRLRRLGLQNVLIVGDAAGATNPIFGGGIHAALSTGRFAANGILGARDDGENSALARYEEQALASPFFHPILSQIARVLAATTDEELSLVARIYRRRRRPGALLRLLPTLMSKPGLLRHLGRLPSLRTALEITARYGW